MYVNKIKFYGSVFVIWLYLQRVMYRHCDLATWPMKVNYIWCIDYRHISVLYKFQSDITTNSGVIKYQNIEKSLFLIIGRLVSMATNKNYLTNFQKIHRLSENQDNRTSIAACTSCKDRQTYKQTARGDQYTLRKSNISKSNEQWHTTTHTMWRSLVKWAGLQMWLR